jgi:hypothetical protein
MTELQACTDLCDAAMVLASAGIGVMVTGIVWCWVLDLLDWRAGRRG